MRKPIIAYVADHAAQRPNAVAIVHREAETTYRCLFQKVCGYRQHLLAHQVKKGDVVVLRAAQSVEYVIQYLSIHSVGAVVASLEKSVSDDSMLSVAQQLHASVIIADNFSLTTDIAVLAQGNVVEIADSYPAECVLDAFPNLEDSADILFTTGTTGASKGVELSHRALVATAENLIYGCQYKPDTVLIAPGPLNHANAVRKLFTSLVNGSTLYILDGMVNMKAFYTALDYPKGTIACCLPPAAIRAIFQLTRDRLGTYADKIDFIESATSPLPEPDKLRLCQLLPKTRLYNNYGSSESASVCMYDYNRYPGKVGCIGKAMPNSEILVVDDDKNVMASSAENMGLLACKGDVNMKGYVNEPALTAEVLIDGVLYTNDIGYIDDEGFIYIVGRKGDVINVGGLKVSPTEVEAAALAIDGVDDCICLGIDDAITGKALKLLVVLQEGCSLTPRDFQKILSAKLEPHKIPRFYETVDAIKRTYNGKLDRKAYQ